MKKTEAEKPLLKVLKGLTLKFKINLQTFKSNKLEPMFLIIKHNN